MATASTLMTTEELLALPDDGIERELIRGELYTVSRGALDASQWRRTSLPFYLSAWLRWQPRPCGRVYIFGARFCLRRDPDTFVRIDLPYISPALATSTDEDRPFVEGVPILAVQILVETDTVEWITRRVREYLAVGVALVWVVDPFFKMVMEYRPNAVPGFFNVHHELSAEPFLPGFRVRVAEIFEA